MVKTKNNSLILEVPYGHDIHDLEFLGVYEHIDKDVTIQQENHGFQVGDVIYYNIQKQTFEKALAINTMESEVCGVISSVIDNHTCKFITSGFILTNRFKFDTDTPLYLSELIPGKLVSMAPNMIHKQIAVQMPDGLRIDIQRGYRLKLEEESTQTDFQPYTQEELDEIIQNIW